MCRPRWRHSPCWTASCHTAADVQKDFPTWATALFSSMGSWRALSAAFPWEMYRISLPLSQLSPTLCLFGPTNFRSSPATSKYSSLPGRTDVAEAKNLGANWTPEEYTSRFHLAQRGKFLSSNKLQAKQLLNFFLSLYWLFAFKKRLANPAIMKALDASRCSVGRICVSASTELCQCTFVLANSFCSKPWPLQCRHYQVRKNWDILLGGFELWILAYRKCNACFLPWPDAALMLGFQRQKVEQD